MNSIEIYALQLQKLEIFDICGLMFFQTVLLLVLFLQNGEPSCTTKTVQGVPITWHERLQDVPKGRLFFS